MRYNLRASEDAFCVPLQRHNRSAAADGKWQDLIPQLRASWRIMRKIVSIRSWLEAVRSCNIRNQDFAPSLQASDRANSGSDRVVKTACRSEAQKEVLQRRAKTVNSYAAGICDATIFHPVVDNSPG